MVRPRSNRLFSYKWNHLINPIIVVKVPKDPSKGHGLTSTK
jgi:hypothetical protein